MLYLYVFLAGLAVFFVGFFLGKRFEGYAVAELHVAAADAFQFYDDVRDHLLGYIAKIRKRL